MFGKKDQIRLLNYLSTKQSAGKTNITAAAASTPNISTKQCQQVYTNSSIPDKQNVNSKRKISRKSDCSLINSSKFNEHANGKTTRENANFIPLSKKSKRKSTKINSKNKSASEEDTNDVTPKKKLKKQKSIVPEITENEDEKQLKEDIQNMLDKYNKNEMNYQESDDEEENTEFEDLDDDKEVIISDVNGKISSNKKQNLNQNSKLKPNDPYTERSTNLALKSKQILATSMFRSLNQYLYTHPSFESRQEFTMNKFKLYHQAYEKVVQDWPVKPIDYLIDVLKKRIKNLSQMKKTTIADVGCGNRPQIALALPDATVHSFDLYSSPFENDGQIVSADMCRLPLDSNECDYAVYSLSLMPTNLRDAIFEANRILKPSGYLLIVEVASRFADYSSRNTGKVEEKHVGYKFAHDLRTSFGFQLTRYEMLPPNGYFVFLCFKKMSSICDDQSKSSLPLLTLKACVYKAR